jgi:hypothetical protein
LVGEIKIAEENHRFIHYTSYDARKRANAAFLISAYSVSMQCTVANLGQRGHHGHDCMAVGFISTWCLTTNLWKTKIKQQTCNKF